MGIQNIIGVPHGWHLLNFGGKAVVEEGSAFDDIVYGYGNGCPE